VIELGAILIGIAVTSLTLAFVTPLTALGSGPMTRPVAWWRDRREARAARAHALGILRSTHAALRSGVPLAGALRLALDGAPALGRSPFLRALRAFELGGPLDASLGQTSGVASHRAVALALHALAIVSAEQLPASRAAAIVGSVADRLAFDERLSQEVASRTSGLRAQVVLLALVVPALAIYLLITLPGLDETLATPLGRFVLIPAAVLFETFGIIASRAIVRGAIA
jgi:Flp pilus assembly protein TadB